MLKHLQSHEDTGRRLCARPGVGAAASIVQASRLNVPHLSIDQPGILLVTSGRKHVRGPGTNLVFETGMIALFGGGRTYDVMNEPTGDAPYRAEAVFIASGLLPTVAPKGARPVDGLGIVAAPGRGLTPALAAAADAIGDGTLPDRIARHRVEELLLWLNNMGHALVAAANPDVEARIRSLVAADPSSDWTSARIAEAVAMSEATLRRRLAEKNTTLSAILLDVRLSTALTLLQSTDDPVTMVSFAVGYDSPSRFAARFRERFGFPPSAIRDSTAI